jgi:predicted transposase/invertase (TIGR01784 family)
MRSAHERRNVLMPCFVVSWRINLSKMKFVDVKNDVAFRKIFGNENKKEILISFLNAVLKLKGDKRLKSIVIANPFQLPILSNMKTSIIDVKARDYRGNIFIVEMQVADILAMDKRLLYYTSKEYSQQIVSGEKYTELNPVIFIGIFDFPFTEGEDYYSHHAICNVETKERVIKDMDFYFIELTKFNKNLKDLTDIMDKWIYFIKEAENLEVVPDNIDDEGLKEAYEDANKNSWTQAELDAYNYAAMREQDDRGRIAAAEKKSLQKGEERKEIEAIIGFYENEVPIPVIAKSLKISIEKVEDVIKNHSNTPL